MTTAPEWEYGFDAPVGMGLMYVTTNDMLAETMHSARPDAPLYRRPHTAWQTVDRVERGDA